MTTSIRFSGNGLAGYRYSFAARVMTIAAGTLLGYLGTMLSSCLAASLCPTAWVYMPFWLWLVPAPLIAAYLVYSNGAPINLSLAAATLVLNVHSAWSDWVGPEQAALARDSLPHGAAAWALIPATLMLFWGITVLGEQLKEK